LDAALREVAQRQAILSRTEIRHSAQSQRRGNRRIIRVCLLVGGMIPVVAEAEFVGQRGTEDMRLAEHEVLGEDEVSLAAISAAIQDRTERKRIQNYVVEITVARVCLV